MRRENDQEAPGCVQCIFDGAIPSGSRRYIELIEPDIDARGAQVGGDLQGKLAVFPRVTDERVVELRHLFLLEVATWLWSRTDSASAGWSIGMSSRCMLVAEGLSSP